MQHPFTAFNFKVEIALDGQNQPLCEAAFNECSGLEMTLAPKTFQEGGNNAEQVHLAGPTSYGQLVLRRGMTTSFDLWDWFETVLAGRYDLRATGVVVMMDPAAASEQARFVLTRCLPVKIKAPALHAQNGQIAIEELTVAYERLSIERPSGGLGLSVGVSAGIGLGVSASASIGVSAGAGVSVSAGISIGF